MEKILLFQVSDADRKIIEKIAGNMRIKTETVGEEFYLSALGEIADGKAQPKVLDNANGRKVESLMLFAGVTQKHFDKILFEMKRQKASVKYKAVMTPTNRAWNIYKLYFQMELECRKMS